MWRVKDLHPRAEQFARTCGISPFLAQIFLNRDMTEEDFKSFTQPCFSALYPATDLPDMKKAVERIKQAVNKGEKILAVGDYDVDGVTSLAIFHEFIKDYPGSFSFYIPHRVKEGYGLNKYAVTKAKKTGTGLIICFDCGTNSFKEIELASSAGIDVIVVDHHHSRDDFNTPFAFINPKRKDCSYPFKDLSAGALSFKLLQALREDDCCEALDLVALSIVCDVVPLKGENRILLNEGLKWIKQTPRMAIKALCDVSRIKQEKIDIFHIGYILGPRINASGRIAHAEDALDVFLTEDKDKLYRKVQKLAEFNKQRKGIEDNILKQAESILSRGFGDEGAIVVSGESWHPGVLGIVASRLAEKYYRPAFVISFDEHRGRGSGRSIHSVHLIEVLEQCSDFLHMYGGHKKAAGIEIFKDNLDLFQERINSLIKENLTPEDFIPVIDIDARMSFKDINMEFIGHLDNLKPFGEENPRPVFVSYSVSKKAAPRRVSNSFSVWLDHQGTTYEGMVYDKDLCQILNYGDSFDIVYSLDRNSYHEVPRLVIKDLRLSQSGN